MNGKSMERVVKIGIMSEAAIRTRMLDIARGKYKPSKDDPKIWFTSMKSVAEILSDKNIELLRMIAEKQPHSVSELAEESGRAVSNLSRTLKTLCLYGIVELKKIDSKRVQPIAKYTKFLIAA